MKVTIINSIRYLKVGRFSWNKFLFTVKRNKRGDDKLYMSAENNGYSKLIALYKQNVDHSTETPIAIDGVQGTILPCEENVAGGK